MTVKIAGLTSGVINQLKEEFQDLVILTPDSPGYAENMERWNVAAEHKAVSLYPPALGHCRAHSNRAL